MYALSWVDFSLGPAGNHTAVVGGGGSPSRQLENINGYDICANVLFVGCRRLRRIRRNLDNLFKSDNGPDLVWTANRRGTFLFCDQRDGRTGIDIFHRQTRIDSVIFGFEVAGMNWWILFVISFCVMEFNAWFLHKYVMHGFLWCLHRDHHVVDKSHVYQLNDLFALVFAVPSFLFILLSSLYEFKIMGAVGYGVMAYGVAYFTVHEVIIHRRWPLMTVPRGRYFRALNAAHKMHHSVLTKEGASNFGMLVVPLRYFTLGRR